MKKLFSLIGIFCLLVMPAFAASGSESASVNISFNIEPFTHIAPVTSPVLTAYIANRSGNLAIPLSTKFKVITNSPEDKTLYLKATTVTSDGIEDAMFEQGGQVYIAFANLAKRPSSNSLQNCKIGSIPKDSPGVVAYPITSIMGVKDKQFISSKSKYEVTVEGGTSYVTVNVGSNVLRSSYAGNDPKGFYQAIVSLTETDI